MIKIEIVRCNGCGSCVEACPQQAIAVQDGLVVINQGLCNQCETCVDVCPVGAISEVSMSYTNSNKGGRSMVYGFGGGFGNRRGAGIGFRGDALTWPYLGRGRGGLPRCQCTAVTSDPHYGLAATLVTREQELAFLKKQAETMKSELNQVESRISELESDK